MESAWKPVVPMLALAFAVSGCTQTQEGSKLTVGTVQKQIRKGMTQTAVAQTLGSPNIVSSDGPGQETWIYDKVSTEAAYTTGSGSVLFLIGWATSSADHGFGTLFTGSTGTASRTQKTLTVVISFKEAKVYDFSYHSTRF